LFSPVFAVFFFARVDPGRAAGTSTAGAEPTLRC